MACQQPEILIEGWAWSKIYFSWPCLHVYHTYTLFKCKPVISNKSGCVCSHFPLF